MFRRSGALACLVTIALLMPAPAGAAGLPDLVVKSMAAPTSVLAGKTITVSTTVANIRRPRTVSSYVRVVLSRDRVLQGTDRVLGNRWVPRLPVNGTSTGKQTYTIPSTTLGGTWYLVACADITKRVREYREGNNCRSVPLTVTRPNRLPVANADAFATAEGQALPLTAASLLANDTDPDAGTTLQVTGVGSPSHGALTPLVSGAFTFTPDADFNGTAGFSYTLSDGIGTTTGAVTVNVAPAPPALVLAPASESVGEGATTMVDVHLSRAPAADLTVTVALAAGSSGILTASPGTLTFTPANWNTPQSVTVGAVNDDDLADEVGAVTFSAPGVETAQVGWDVLDDDTQLIQASPVSVTVTEGSTTTFGVRLAFQPAGDVTVAVSSLDTTAVTVSTSSLVFTPSNWATLQNVTVAGVEDVDLTNESAVVSLTSSGLTSKSVTATVNDNDTQAVHASVTSKFVNEGSSTTVGITLSYQPLSNTTVTCTSSPSGSVGVSPSTLTFTPSNYSTPQNITLFGTIDGDQADDEATVTCSATNSSSATIAVWVVENV